MENFYGNCPNIKPKKCPPLRRKSKINIFGSTTPAGQSHHDEIIGSTTPASVSCDKGSYRMSNNCIPCPEGSYCPVGSREPIKCEVGTYCPGGSSEPIKCQAGTYQDSTGASTCKVCDKGTYSDSGASICTNCSVGTYQDSTGVPNCKLCGQGTYSGIGASICTNCSSGTYQDSTGAPSCKLCGKGTYSMTGSSICTNCSAGTYQDSTGAPSCKLCDKGTYSGIGSSICTSCSAGTYQDSTGAPSCKLCDKGTYSDSGSSICTNCSAGTYQDSTGAPSCKLCGKGTYSDSGASICTNCSAGTYQDSTGAPQCKVCGIGTYQNETSKSSCKNLPNNSTASTDRKDFICNDGYYRSGDECILCPSGTSSDVTTYGKCMPCPPGTSSDATTYGKCEDCGGKFYNDIKGKECKLCPLGSSSYKHSEYCQKCPNGTYIDNKSSLSRYGTCRSCPNGTFNTGDGNVLYSGVEYNKPDPNSVTDISVGQYIDFYKDNQIIKNKRVENRVGTGINAQYTILLNATTRETTTTTRDKIVILQSGCLLCPFGNYCKTKTTPPIIYDYSPNDYDIYETSKVKDSNDFIIPWQNDDGEYNKLSSNFSYDDMLLINKPLVNTSLNKFSKFYYIGNATKISRIEFSGKIFITNSNSFISFVLCNIDKKTNTPKLVATKEIKFIPGENNNTIKLDTGNQTNYFKNFINSQGKLQSDILTLQTDNNFNFNYFFNYPRDNENITDYYILLYITAVGGGSNKTNIKNAKINLVDELEYQTYATIDNCPEGYYCDEKGMSVPKECPKGSYCPYGTINYIDCPAGSYCPSTKLGNPLDCPEGYYCPTPQEKYICPAGKYNNIKGQTNCKDCPAGSYCPTGSINPISCKFGNYCQTGSSSEEECPEGYYCPTPREKYICPAGKYNNIKAQTNCKDCPVGSYCPEGSINPISCKFGSYCPSGSKSEEKCPVDTFCPLFSTSISNPIPLPPKWSTKDTYHWSRSEYDDISANTWIEWLLSNPYSTYPNADLYVLFTSGFSTTLESVKLIRGYKHDVSGNNNFGTTAERADPVINQFLNNPSPPVCRDIFIRDENNVITTKRSNYDWTWRKKNRRSRHSNFWSCLYS